MKPWARITLLLAIGGAFLGLLAWAFQPRPTLDGVDRLILNERFEQAERQIKAYLRAYPAQEEIHLLLAQVAVQQSEPKPKLALNELRHVHPRNDAIAAHAKLIEGKAKFYLKRYDEAEAALNEALRLNPEIADAGWLLLNIYAMQGRTDDSRRLALKLHEVEPDPHDRVQLLLQLLRENAHPIAAGSIIQQLEPAVAQNPKDLPSTLALGLALVHDGKTDAGLTRLREAVQQHPDSTDAWDAYLTGLADAGQMTTLAETLDRLPEALAENSRFDDVRGRVAQERQDWPAAVRFYRPAWERHPDDVKLAYRLSRALRNAGDDNAAQELGPRLARIEEARKSLRELYDQADTLPALGVKPYPDFYQEIAETLETLGRIEEARVWHRLVLSDQPNDPISRDALARLDAP